MKKSIRPDFQYQKGSFYCESIELSKLVKKFSTPLYVYSENNFKNKIMRYQNALKNLNYNIFYAVKANSNLTILKKIKSLHCGVDLVSIGELKRAEKVGFKHEKMVFSGVGKTKEELLYALRLPLHSINIESEAEFKMIQLLVNQYQIKNPCALSFRFNPDVNPKTHPYISTGLKENKFGLDREEILKVLHDYFSEKNQNLNIKGLSVHIGSQIESLTPFKEALQKTLDLMTAIEEKFPIKLKILDCGGGIGIPYKGNEKLSIESYGVMIQKLFNLEKNRRWKELQLGFEPGRSIIGSSGILITKVIFRKSKAHKEFLVVDAGMNDLMRPALYQSVHEILPLKEKFTKGLQKKTDIVGPVCESSDFFVKNIKINAEINSEDFLVILDTGAYGMSMSNQYNSRLRPAEILVSKNSYKQIRKRDSFEDLIKGEIC